MEDAKRCPLWHGMFLFLLGPVTGCVEQQFTDPPDRFLLPTATTHSSPHSQATVTGAPTPMPSRRAALSPTNASSSRSLEPIRATSVPLGCSA
jgi:hypothetical protein